MNGYRKRWKETLRLVDELQAEIRRLEGMLEDKQAEMVLRLTRAEHDASKELSRVRRRERRSLEAKHQERMDKQIDRLAIEKAHR